MKKLIALAVAVVMIGILAGCQPAAEQPDDEKPSSEQPGAPEEPKEVETVPTEIEDTGDVIQT